MNLLFVGRSSRLLAWLSNLVDDRRHTITHCPDGNQALLVLEKSPVDFDWILLEGRETTGEGAVVSRAVRAMGCGVPILFLASNEAQNETENAPTLLCALERTPRGTKVLNCHLAANTPNASSRCPPTAADIVFEYHSPCTRVGRGRR